MSETVQTEPSLTPSIVGVLEDPKEFPLLLAGLVFGASSVIARYTGLPHPYMTVVWQSLEIISYLAILFRFRLRPTSFSTDDFGRIFGLLCLAFIAWNIQIWTMDVLGVEQVRASVQTEVKSAGGIALSDLLNDPKVWAGFFMACIGAPVSEELLYRGIVARSATRNGCSVPMALMLQAWIFALSHGDWSLVPYYLFMGLLLGLSSLTCWGLGLSILVHGLANGLLYLNAWLHLP